MSLLINDMEMPKNCLECMFRISYWKRTLTPSGEIFTYGCMLNRKEINILEKRCKDCPIVEIPTPRGRLIDADYLRQKLEKHREMCGDFELAHGIDEAIRILENATIIIEAENSSAIDDDVKKYCDYLKSETYDFCNRIENGEVSE